MSEVLRAARSYPHTPNYNMALTARIKSPKELFTLFADRKGLTSSLESEWIGDLRTEALKIRDALCQHFGQFFELKMEGQDRSDYAQLEIPQSMLNNPDDRWVEIRLSNTAPLVAISDEQKLMPDRLEEIKRILEQCDYIVVDRSAFEFSKSESPDYLQDSETLWRSLFDYD